MRFLITLAALATAFGAHAQDTLEDKVATAQAAESRPEADVEHRVRI